MICVQSQESRTEVALSGFFFRFKAYEWVLGERLTIDRRIGSLLIDEVNPACEPNFERFHIFLDNLFSLYDSLLQYRHTGVSDVTGNAEEVLCSDSTTPL